MQLIALIILVLLSAFFSSAETSLTTVNRVRLKTLAEEGNRRAKTALEAGHDQSILFRHYRSLVLPEMAERWFAIMPPLEMQRGLVGICRGTIGKPERKGIAAAEMGDSRVGTTMCAI